MKIWIIVGTAWIAAFGGWYLVWDVADGAVSSLLGIVFFLAFGVTSSQLSIRHLEREVSDFRRWKAKNPNTFAGLRLRDDDVSPK